ncbi:P-selectin glycoprotein ligand 1 [Cynoglossus semilaevis]|uniref:P-selectin glycoprotein ligand 1 n=1 Tax=Cynoglossus semilaevis TaxID=244447 RepID=UPI000D62BDE7|nr:P-selectin glycoprotein ligand 1 [Cynoglossus semilaevis]
MRFLSTEASVTLFCGVCVLFSLDGQATPATLMFKSSTTADKTGRTVTVGPQSTTDEQSTKAWNPTGTGSRANLDAGATSETTSSSTVETEDTAFHLHPTPCRRRQLQASELHPRRSATPAQPTEATRPHCLTQRAVSTTDPPTSTVSTTDPPTSTVSTTDPPTSTVSTTDPPTTSSVSTSPTGSSVVYVPRKLPPPSTTLSPSTILTRSTTATTTTTTTATTTTAGCGVIPSLGVQPCSTRGLVKQCLIIVACLAVLTTIFMVSTIVLCTKVSTRKYKLRRPQQSTEMMCISSLLPERNYTYARQRSPVSNGVLVIHDRADSEEELGDNLTLSSFLPDNDRYV